MSTAAKAIVALAVGITGGIAITQMAKHYAGDVRQEAAIDSRAEYEFIAPLPDKLGVYKFYDIPEQKVCYFTLGYEGRGALSCETINPDLQADPSAIKE